MNEEIFRQVTKSVATKAVSILVAIASMLYWRSWGNEYFSGH